MKYFFHKRNVLSIILIIILSTFLTTITTSKLYSALANKTDCQTTTHNVPICGKITVTTCVTLSDRNNDGAYDHGSVDVEVKGSV